MGEKKDFLKGRGVLNDKEGKITKDMHLLYIIKTFEKGISIPNLDVLFFYFFIFYIYYIRTWVGENKSAFIRGGNLPLTDTF